MRKPSTHANPTADSRLRLQRGLTLIELLVALLIGTLVLAAGIKFLFNTGKTITMGTEQDKVTADAQLAMQNMSKEIKRAAIDAPPLFNVTPAWVSLPALPYNAYELTPYLDTLAGVVMPAPPAARKFASQTGLPDIYHKWYPNPTGNESNSLVMYIAPPPAPGAASSVQRITYRVAGGKLIREVQSPLSSASLQFGSNPAPMTTTLANNVKWIQFSYPNFEQAMTTALDTQLTTLTEPARTQYINENFRKLLRIRLVMGGLKLGSQDTPSVEQTTEVRLRSE